MDTNAEIGKRLKEWIRSSPYTQIEIAQKVGVTPVAISNYIKGSYLPKKQFLDGIKALGADTDYILTGIKGNQSEIKGDLIAKYFIPNVRKIKKVLVDTEVNDDGISVSIFAPAETVVYDLPSTTQTLVAENDAEPLETYYDTNSRAVRQDKAAASPIYHKKGVK